MALCHDWLAARHGSEKTFEVMAGTLPTAAVHGLSYDSAAGLDFGGRRVRTTFIDRLAPIKNRRMAQLPLMPLAWRYASRRRYDVVVTSSHACAKGFWPARAALHLCYCYTPMRYLWLPSIDARRRRSALSVPAERWLRSWDLGSVRWVDEFAAISNTVRDRIGAIYGRPARVIYPPVDTAYFTPGASGTSHMTPGAGGFALAVSRMVPYKRLDLAIRACHRAGYPLVIAGRGPMEPALRDLAGRLGAAVKFVIAPSDDELRRLYRAADVVVFPGQEDFGIVPVEAQACGTPVVALDRGGTAETVVHGVTGVLVASQDEESFAAGIREALSAGFDAGQCRQNAERFSEAIFKERFLDWVIGSAAIRGIHVGGQRTLETA